MGEPFHDELLGLAVSAAEEAAGRVRTSGPGGVPVAATKSTPVDVVTEVDRACERLIRDRVLAARPGDGFLGEEEGSVATRSGVTWIVDPIDGTVNLVYGIPRYSVSVAARVDDTVVAGVVVDVPSGERFTATLGGGAYLADVPLSVRPRAPLAQRLVITGFSYRADVRARQAVAVSRLLPQVRDIRRLGSAALDLCTVAAGRADGYVEEGLNIWDRAAGGLVATEAGATVRISPGAGGTDTVLCAPADGFEELAVLVRRCGLLE